MPSFTGDNALLTAQQLARKKISKKKVPTWRYPNQIEKTYVYNLTKLVNQWRDKMIEFVLPHIDELSQEASIRRPVGANDIKGDSIKLDDWSDKLDELMGVYNVQIGLDEVRGVQELNFTAHEVSQFNNKQWFKITNSIMGVPLWQYEPWLESTIKSFAKENVALIKELQSTTIQQTNTTINRGIKQGLRSKTIKDQLIGIGIKPLKMLPKDTKADIMRKTKIRAALIARDQIGKLNGQLTQLRQTGVGISRYFWNDVNDERVRKTHRAMNGLLCDWSNASVYSIDGGKSWLSRSSVGGVDLHPGQDYQCRCFASPDFSTISLGNL